MPDHRSQGNGHEEEARSQEDDQEGHREAVAEEGCQEEDRQEVGGEEGHALAQEEGRQEEPGQKGRQEEVVARGCNRGLATRPTFDPTRQADGRRCRAPLSAYFLVERPR